MAKPEQEARLQEALSTLHQQPASLEALGALGQIETLMTELLAENKQLQASLEQARAARTSYLSAVTHELRIPMTSILGYTDLLRKGLVGPVNSQQLDFLNVIRSNVERMSVLVSDLSDLNRSETGRLALSLSSFPAQQVALEALQALKPRFEAKHQQLELEIAERSLPILRSDATRVIQILTNLLTNAWKYTPEAGQIWFRVLAEGDGVRYEVEDNGIGISPEDQAHLFIPFFRSEDEAVRAQTGWGLGLSVSRRLAELLGGTLDGESQLGQGSRFWLHLPAHFQEEA